MNAQAAIPLARVRSEDQRSEALFVWLFGALAVARAACLFLGDPERIVLALPVVESAAAVAALVLLRKRPPRSPYHLPLIAVVLMGTIVGAVYCSDGGNAVGKWLNYSGLGISWVVALYAGRAMGGTLGWSSLVRVFLLAALGDVLMLIPRLTVINIDRAPYGTTYLLFGLVILSVLPVAGRVIAVAAVAGALLGLAGGALSGMRVSLTFSVVSVLLAGAYALRLRRRRLTNLAPRLIAAGMLVVPLAAAGASMLPTIETQVSFVQARLEATVFNQEGFTLDENVMGSRQDELERSYSEFEHRNDVGAWIWGFGHGFVYDNGIETTAHVHVTPVAFFLRYGIIGVVIYLFMFVFSLGSVASAWRREPSNWNAIYLSFQVAASLYWLNSLVGGVLVFPQAWLLIGAADALRTRPPEAVEQ